MFSQLHFFSLYIQNHNTAGRCSFVVHVQPKQTSAGTSSEPPLGKRGYNGSVAALWTMSNDEVLGISSALLLFSCK